MSCVECGMTHARRWRALCWHLPWLRGSDLDGARAEFTAASDQSADAGRPGVGCGSTVRHGERRGLEDEAPGLGHDPVRRAVGTVMVVAVFGHQRYRRRQLVHGKLLMRHGRSRMR